MSFYNHITTVEIAERGALSAMPIGTAGAAWCLFTALPDGRRPGLNHSCTLVWIIKWVPLLMTLMNGCLQVFNDSTYWFSKGAHSNLIFSIFICLTFEGNHFIICGMDLDLFKNLGHTDLRRLTATSHSSLWIGSVTANCPLHLCHTTGSCKGIYLYMNFLSFCNPLV